MICPVLTKLTGLLISCRPLDDAEISLLKKGLNFAVAPVYIPATEIIAKVESPTIHLDAEQADTVRRAVNKLLTRELTSRRKCKTPLNA